MFEWWSIPRKGWLIILTELCIIIGLAGGVITQYVNDIFSQNYLNSLALALVPVLSVGFGILSALAATILYRSLRKPRRAVPRHAAIEDSSHNKQSSNQAIHSSITRSRAAKPATNPHHQANKPKQPRVFDGQETAPPVSQEEQEGS